MIGVVLDCGRSSCKRAVAEVGWPDLSSRFVLKRESGGHDPVRGLSYPALSKSSESS